MQRLNIQIITSVHIYIHAYYKTTFIQSTFIQYKDENLQVKFIFQIC